MPLALICSVTAALVLGSGPNRVDRGGDGTHVWIESNMLVSYFFDSSAGVTGVSGRARATATASVATATLDPIYGSLCQSLTGFDIDTVASEVLGTSVQTSVNVTAPDPNDPDCMNPNDPECNLFVLCDSSCAYARAAIVQAPSPGNANEMEIHTFTQSQAQFDICYRGSGATSERTPPAYFASQISSNARASAQGDYIVSQPRTFTAIARVIANVGLFVCENAFDCLESSGQSRGPSLLPSQLHVIAICGESVSELLWVENTGPDFVASEGVITTIDSTEDDYERRTFEWSIQSPVSSGIESVAYGVRSWALDSSLLGDMNQDGLLDCCDLAILHSMTATQSISLCDEDYSPAGDLDLDAEISANDRLALMNLALPGDATGDCVVDFDDISLVLANFEVATSDQFEGDLDGNGIVDFDDISFVMANWNPNSECE